MKKPFVKYALLLAVPLALFTLTLGAKPLVTKAPEGNAFVFQGSDLDARLQAVEKRIAALKTAVSTKPQYKSQRGAVATLENKKNTLKSQVKTGPKNNAGRPQLEQEMKALEDKVAELESQIK